MTVSFKSLVKYTPLAAVFVAAASVEPSPSAPFVLVPAKSEKLPEAAPVNPLPPKSVPVVVKSTKNSVQTAVDVFRADFLSRVERRKETLFNKCFTRKDGEIDPFVVNLIRRGSPALGRDSLLTREIDYTQKPIVIIDEGHGVSGESGAVVNGLREENVINALASGIKAGLEQKGADVVRTRPDNLGHEYRFFNQTRILQWRAELAYELAASFPDRPVLFLSIHADIAPEESIGGAGAFYFGGAGEHSAVSAEFAKNMTKHYSAPGGRSRAKTGDFAVTRCVPADMPVVLLEAGFLNNAEDHEYLKGIATNKRNAARAADTIISGIFGFLEQKQKTQSLQPPTVIAAAEMQGAHLRQ